MLNDITARYLRALTADVTNEFQKAVIIDTFFQHRFFASEYVASTWSDPCNPLLTAKYKARACVAADRMVDKLINHLEEQL